MAITDCKVAHCFSSYVNSHVVAECLVHIKFDNITEGKAFHAAYHELIGKVVKVESAKPEAPV